MSHATLLIAHGSRRAEANADLYALAEQIRQSPPGGVSHVDVGFLELTPPTIPEGFAACVAAGATSVRIVPYFLSMGVHMKEDLGELCEQFARDYPDVAISVAPPLGLDPRVVDVIRQRCEVESTSDESATPATITEAAAP